MGESTQRQINPTIARAVLGYVETALGPKGLVELTRHMPGSAGIDELARTDRWWSREEFTELATAAFEVTGDVDLGRRVGEQTFRDTLGGSVAELVQSCGTTEVACTVMADYSSRMSVGRTMTVVESSDAHVIIEGRYVDGVPPDRFSCGFTAGYFASLPALFGNLGTSAEVACQGRGGSVCRFRIAWRPDPSRTHDDAPEEREVRGATMLEQLEAQHALSAHLVDAHEIDDVLDRVVTNVGLTVGAPQYVLGVRLGENGERMVHQVGFEGDDAEVLIDMLEAGERLGEQYVVVKVRHGDHTYGHLVAGFPPGATGSVVDQRVLRSYARYAGSAIQIVAALDSARRDRDTSGALLDFASALARAGDTVTVARNLCIALPTASACDVATVWLFDSIRGVVRLADARDAAGQELVSGTQFASVDLTEYLNRDGGLDDPFMLESDEISDQLVPAIGSDGASEVAVIPITNGEQVIGVATAAFAQPLGRSRSDVVARLGGLADQAVTAFENARLVEQMRHRALHDDLTGLPNRMLAEDRARLALARRERSGEQVAMLFIDIDDFKDINDTLGHAAGDELLRQFADRVTGQLRATDTCARIGGDEFIVIVTGPPSSGDVEGVGKRLVEALEEPFVLDGRPHRLTASIGIAQAGESATTFEALIRRADAAMYAAKDSGRARFVRST